MALNGNRQRLLPSVPKHDSVLNLGSISRPRLLRIYLVQNCMPHVHKRPLFADPKTYRLHIFEMDLSRFES